MLVKAQDNDKNVLKEKVEKDFNFLLQPGNYGFYNRAEVTTIYIYGKKFPVTNLFTIIVFEDADVPSNPLIKENERLQINTDLNIGLQIEYYTLDNIRNRFFSLINDNVWKDYGGQPLRCSSELKLLNKKFVPIDGTVKIPVNKVLKNNFFTGSYIIEFFDEKKEFISEIYDSKPFLLKTDDFLKHKKMPIDLAYMRDRLGNIIFQFPSELISFTEMRNKNKNGINLDIAWNPKLKKIPKCDSFCLSELDKEVVGFGKVTIEEEKSSDIIMGNPDNMKKTLIINSENGLILASDETMFVKDFEIAMNVSSAHSEPRTIKGVSGNWDNVELIYKQKNSKRKKDYDNFLKERVFDEERQHFKQFLNDHDGATKYIRELIQKNDEDGVYLWDPFLSANDIINTLFYSNAESVEIKAICSNDAWHFFSTSKKNESLVSRIKSGLASVFSSKTAKNEESSFKKWKKQQIENFSQAGNLKGLNLEFKIKRNISGWDFHDRFLIFPKKDHPIVFSLGSSINHIGAKHTIIVRVENAALIQNSFETLWNLLNSEECLIWRSNDSKI